MSKNKFIIASVVAGMSLSALGPLAHGQDDFAAPPDFGNSALPPNGGFPSEAGGGKAAVTTGLDKGQKQKFNKSGIEDINSQNFPETIESFDFPNAEITDIIKTISELTGKNFIIDPGVRGKITIIAPTKITVAEAYKAFLSALAINGYTVVPSGSFLKVKNARNAQRDSIETYSGAYYPNDDQMITRIIHLKHISAEVVNQQLRILPSKDGEMVVYTPTNSIIMSDYGSNIDRVMKIINQLDVPGFEEQIEVVPIRYAKAKDMADLIDKIVNKGQKTNTQGPAGTFSSGVPRFSRTTSGAQGQSGNAFFMAIPDDRTNAIIVVGNNQGIARVKKLIAQLDFRIRPEDSGGVYVYYLKHGDAEKIAQVLSGVTKDATPKASSPQAPGGFPNFGFGGPQAAASNTQIFGGDVKITADKNTNSLIVVASKQDYEQVLNLLSKIDIARDQVYVEAVIMEMTANDGTNWGISYYQYSPSGYGKSGFGGLTGSTLSDLISPSGGSGAILGFGQGNSVTVTDPTTKTQTTIPSLLGFINFLKSNAHGNILSTPQITALDNEEASIEVGDKVATSLTTTTGTNQQTSQSANFEDATIKLKIKPFISPASNSIRMEIDQSVKQPSQAVGPKALQDNTISLATRSIKTNIVVGNGDTAILGGLMKDQETEKITKVPILGDLPIIGWLFKSRDSSKDKVNLVVFLTPKILRSALDTNQIISKKLNERLEFVKGAGGRDPYGSTVDDIQKSMKGAAERARDERQGPVSNSEITRSTKDQHTDSLQRAVDRATQPVPKPALNVEKAQKPQMKAQAPVDKEVPAPDDSDEEANPEGGTPLTE